MRDDRAFRERETQCRGVSRRSQHNGHAIKNAARTLAGRAIGDVQRQEMLVRGMCVAGVRGFSAIVREGGLVAGFDLVGHPVVK